ncbi:MAG: amidohydrolase [Solirubrobacteraceae bacterium]
MHAKPAELPLPADLIVAGNVLTLDDARPRAEAFAVRGNTVMMVGDLADVRAACPPGTPVDHPAGAAIIPGLIDTHVHLQRTGLKLLRLVGDAGASIDEQLMAIDRDAATGPRVVGRPTLQQRLDGLVLAQRLMHALGVTGVIDPAVTPVEMSAYQEARRQGLLSMRVVAMPHARIQDGPTAIVERLRGLGVASGFGDEVLRLGGVKVRFDGIGVNGTALRRRPWPQPPTDDPARGGVTTPEGWQRLPTEELTRIARACAQSGWSLGVHVGGGGGIGRVLDVFAAIDADAPIGDLRFTLIHAYLEPTPEDMARAAAMGVVVAAQPAIQWVDGAGLADRLGPGAATSNPLRSWIDAGVRVAGGSNGPDFPLDPRLGLWQATTRKVRGSDLPLGPQEAITPAEALTLYTRDASHACGGSSARYRGSLGPGMAADWTAISVDPLTDDRDALLTATFARTTIGGVAVHAADGGPPVGPTPTTSPIPSVAPTHR